MKILSVDDHPLFREAVKSVLEQLSSEQTQIIEAASCEEALELCQTHPDLDLIVLDFELPGMDGLSGLCQLRDCQPATPIVMISATEERDTIMNAIEQGAKGFIPKSSSAEVMLSALQLVLSGGVYLPMAVMDVPGSNNNSKQNTSTLKTASNNNFKLTPKQMDVLQVLAKGKSNREIASHLGMAENTVRVHVRAILSFLDVSNRTEAGYAASQNGLLVSEES